MRTPDRERIGRIQEALQDSYVDAVVATLPADVLLLSGYWPVTGTAIAVAARDGIGILAPEDEKDLADRGWADVVRFFRPGSLARIETLAEAVRTPLADLGKALALRGGRVGYRRGPDSEAATYAAMHLYGAAIVDLLGEALPGAALVPADTLLTRLRAVKTPTEVGHIRRACRIAEIAFLRGAGHVRAGRRETEVAEAFRTPLSVDGVGFEGAARADGFVYCMSGPDSTQASGAYARSRAHELSPGAPALIHANTYADGYWTDITRTFYLGPPDEQARGRYEAVLEANRAAREAVAPGVRAADVDRAAREVLAARGLGAAFPHSTGHGVGFAAFNPDARPRIHPASPDVLETGMVFNIEPAVYLEGWGGLRHCDMVTVTNVGVELLTPFQSRLEELTTRGTSQ